MQQNFDTLLQTIQHYKLFTPATTVIIAVSGGADSLALLHWMADHKQHLNINIHVATLNHNIRPESADEVRYVQQVAESLGIPSTIGSIPVPSIARNQQISIETAARKARYDFFAELAGNLNTETIVTAHHADDQSETILMHILRGSGTQGLTGMHMRSPLPYHPHLTLIRPLLQIRRTEIEAYCQQYQLQPRLDPSNNDTQYRRNEIRLEILPRLRQINPQLDPALARLAEIASTEQEFMAQIYQEHFRKDVEFSGRVSISISKFSTWHRAMQRRFFLDALAYLKIEPSFEHIENAIDLARTAKVGTLSEFPEQAHMRIGYENLYIEPLNLELPSGDYLQLDNPAEINIPGRLTIGDYELLSSKEPLPEYDACIEIPQNARVWLRTRQPGDRFRPRGMNGHSQKIKECLVNNKVPAYLRDSLPLLIVNDEIVGILLPERWKLAEALAENETSQHKVYFKVNKLL